MVDLSRQKHYVERKWAKRTLRRLERRILKALYLPTPTPALPPSKEAPREV